MSDREQHDRYERWLADLASHLADRGITCHLGFDDRHMGDIMYMGVPGGAGYSELVVLRGKRQKATAILLSETAEAARHLADAVRGAHRDVRRIRNAKRRFWHLVEHMADRLAIGFAEWANRYPDQVLERLQEVIAETRPMIGTASHRHIKSKSGRVEVQFAASIPMDAQQGGPPRRALRYNDARGAFEGHGEALRAVHARADSAGVGLGDVVVAGATAGAVLGAGPLAASVDAEQKEQSWWDTVDCSLEALSCGCDSWDCAAAVTDIGCEMPDCDILDIPDCSLDCGI